MTLSLTTRDLARLEATTRVMLSPLALPDVDSWRRETMHAFSELLGAQAGTFHLSGQPRPLLFHHIDEAFVEPMLHYTAPMWDGRGTTVDPELDLFYRLLVRHNVELWDMYSADQLLGGRGRAWDTRFYHDVLIHTKGADANALIVRTPEGTAHLTANQLSTAEPGLYLPLLQVLLPTFKAGLHALGRLSAWRSALDLAAEALIVFDADGTERHRNPALVRLLQAEPEARRVETALAGLSIELRRLAFPVRRDALGQIASPVRELATARGRYTLRGAALQAEAFGPGEAFLVSVQLTGEKPGLPPAGAVQARFGLSRREAEVALLVAQGLTNEQIAETLFVSKHTVRHHVEAIMAKLDLSGQRRAAVAARLLQADELVPG